MKLKLRSAVRTGLGFDFQHASGGLKVFALEKRKKPYIEIMLSSQDVFIPTEQLNLTADDLHKAVVKELSRPIEEFDKAVEKICKKYKLKRKDRV